MNRRRGREQYKWGGSWRNSIYCWSPGCIPRIVKISVQYAGCFKDQGRRALPKHLGDHMTGQECFKKAKAAGYKYAGLQYGQQCFAGN
jgi:hypothetical protein